jgi:hypothetical protein
MMNTQPTTHRPEGEANEPHDAAVPAISTKAWGYLTGILEHASRQLFRRAQEAPLDDNLIREAKALFDCAMKLERIEQAAQKRGGGGKAGPENVPAAERLPVIAAELQVSPLATTPGVSTVRIAGFSPESTCAAAVTIKSPAVKTTATSTNSSATPAAQTIPRHNDTPRDETPPNAARPDAAQAANPAQLRKAQRKARRVQRRKAQSASSATREHAVKNGRANFPTLAAQEEVKRLGPPLAASGEARCLFSRG